MVGQRHIGGQHGPRRHKERQTEETDRVATVLRAHNLLQHIMREKGRVILMGLILLYIIRKIPTTT